jgi:hypothetical protein
MLSWVTTADIALLFSIANGVWSFWVWKTDRPSFKVEVFWDWNDADVPSVPSITIRNLGRKAGQVDTIEARTGDGDREPIVWELEREVEAGRSFTYRPDWSEGAETPSFRKPWKTLRIAVEDGEGRWWLSKPAKEKPKWYYCRMGDDL